MQLHKLACSSFLRLSSSQEFCSACYSENVAFNFFPHTSSMIRISVAHSAAWVHEWSTQRLHKEFSLIILAHVLFIWAGDIYMVIHISMVISSYINDLIPDFFGSLVLQKLPAQNVKSELLNTLSLYVCLSVFLFPNKSIYFVLQMENDAKGDTITLANGSLSGLMVYPKVTLNRG